MSLFGPVHPAPEESASEARPTVQTDSSRKLDEFGKLDEFEKAGFSFSSGGQTFYETM